MARKSKLATATLLFSVIYEVDFAPDRGVGEFRPPHPSRWTLTESGPSEWETELPRWKHRKWCGVLTRNEFKDFMLQCWLTAEATETLGALGSPAFGRGWSPAISCRIDADMGAFGSAYVSPFRNTSDPDKTLEKDFNRVKKALLSLW